MLILLLIFLILFFIFPIFYSITNYFNYLKRIRNLRIVSQGPLFIESLLFPLDNLKTNSSVKDGQVYLIHGTFAISAPLKEWANMIKERLPRFASLPIFLTNVIIEKIYQRASDLGVFTEEYSQKIQNDYGLPCQLFFWSGHNDHWERLNAAFLFILKLEKDSHLPPKTIYVLAHSHAGSILALCSQIIFNKNFLPEIQKTLPDFPVKTNYSWPLIFEKSQRLKDLKMFFITLGMAPRYSFYECPNLQILHFIHSPQSFPWARHWFSIFFGAKGDFIQQWALAGSDTKSLYPKIRSCNKKLDAHFDLGNNLFSWTLKIRTLNRISPYGKTILIDFDQDYRLLTFLKKIMGHGQYTQIKYQTSLFSVIFKHQN